MSKIQFDADELKDIVYQAIKEKVGTAINYSEMHQVIGQVIEDRGDEIRSLANEALDAVFADEGMKKAIVEEFQHKVAKTLVAKLEGAVERSVNDYRSDPTLRAKMILGIERIIDDHDLQGSEEAS